MKNNQFGIFYRLIDLLFLVLINVLTLTIKLSLETKDSLKFTQEKVVEKPRSVMFSPIKAPAPSSPIRAPSPNPPPPVQTTKRAALDIPVLGCKLGPCQFI